MCTESSAVVQKRKPKFGLSAPTPQDPALLLLLVAKREDRLARLWLLRLALSRLAHGCGLWLLRDGAGAALRADGRRRRARRLPRAAHRPKQARQASACHRTAAAVACGGRLARPLACLLHSVADHRARPLTLRAAVAAGDTDGPDLPAAPLRGVAGLAGRHGRRTRLLRLRHRAQRARGRRRRGSRLEHVEPRAGRRLDALDRRAALADDRPDVALRHTHFDGVRLAAARLCRLCRLCALLRRRRRHPHAPRRALSAACKQLPDRGVLSQIGGRPALCVARGRVCILVEQVGDQVAVPLGGRQVEGRRLPLRVAGVDPRATLDQLLAHRLVAVLRRKVERHHAIDSERRDVSAGVTEQADDRDVARPRREVQRRAGKLVRLGRRARVRLQCSCDRGPVPRARCGEECARRRGTALGGALGASCARLRLAARACGSGSVWRRRLGLGRQHRKLLARLDYDQLA
mmetsp:Transcript_7967/g.26334  ORF Transcript_7967/g.26334 Transcript_7967/m.26334 type:complete len:463 (+) Transcript_7967:49-1437(+)